MPIKTTGCILFGGSPITTSNKIEKNKINNARTSNSIIISKLVGEDLHYMEKYGIANLETVVDELKAKTGTNSLKNLTPKKPFISRLMSMSFEAIYNVIK